MSEIKPVYQTFINTDGRFAIINLTTDDKSVSEKWIAAGHDVNTLYTAEAYEALQKENAAQAKRIEELEAATNHLGLTPKQAADGLARHKAQVAEIESLRKQVKLYEKTQSNELIKMRDTVKELLDQNREVIDILSLRIDPIEIVERVGSVLSALNTGE